MAEKPIKILSRTELRERQRLFNGLMIISGSVTILTLMFTILNMSKFVIRVSVVVVSISLLVFLLSTIVFHIIDEIIQNSYDSYYETKHTIYKFKR